MYSSMRAGSTCMRKQTRSISGLPDRGGSVRAEVALGHLGGVVGVEETSVPFDLDLLERPVLCLRGPDHADEQGRDEEAEDEDADAVHTGLLEHEGEPQREHADHDAHDHEHETLGRGAVAGGEELDRPQTVEGLCAQARGDAPADGDGQQREAAGVTEDEHGPDDDADYGAESIEPATGDLVAVAHETEEGGGAGQSPDEDLQEVLGTGVSETGGLVDAGLEDAGLSGHGVPESVDADEEEQCGDVLLLGEHLEDAAVGADRARIRLLLTPAPRFAQSATDPPGDEGDDEQMGEDDPRAQQSHGLE